MRRTPDSKTRLVAKKTSIHRLRISCSIRLSATVTTFRIVFRSKEGSSYHLVLPLNYPIRVSKLGRHGCQVEYKSNCCAELPIFHLDRLHEPCISLSIANPYLQCCQNPLITAQQALLYSAATSKVKPGTGYRFQGRPFYRAVKPRSRPPIFDINIYALQCLSGRSDTSLATFLRSIFSEQQPYPSAAPRPIRTFVLPLR